MIYVFFVAGYQIFWHGGELVTYISRLYLIPSKNAGFFLSTNGFNRAGFGINYLVFDILDRLLDLPPAQSQAQLCRLSSLPPVPLTPTLVAPSLDYGEKQKMKSYMGTFRHPAFDDITIYLNGSDQHLHLLFGRFGHARLQSSSRANHSFDGTWLDPLRAFSYYMRGPDLRIDFDNEFEHNRAKMLRINLGSPEATVFQRNLDIDNMDEYICGSNAAQLTYNEWVLVLLISLFLVYL